MFKKIFGVLLILLGIFITGFGLLLLLVNLDGLWVSLVGVALIFVGRKLSKRPSPEKIPSPPVPQSPIDPPSTDVSSPDPHPQKDETLPASEPSKKIKVETHHVAGTSFRQKELSGLLSLNDEYDCSKSELIDMDIIDERVYKFEPLESKAELVEEPDNPHDPNAIMVIVEGIHIGYIKAGSCSHIKKLMKNDRIEAILVRIEGGPYKIIREYYNDNSDKYAYDYSRETTDYFATLKISVRLD